MRIIILCLFIAVFSFMAGRILQIREETKDLNALNSRLSDNKMAMAQIHRHHRQMMANLAALHERCPDPRTIGVTCK